ncbi:UPF0481 protein At3g47200-like [Phoenix dactylifera]|uniref:UPF0481 protein At3g47200-like n=1 Tax=Phoenix dactylifera TaxID=42345 RepID=A0A8B8ZN41_PHODC|nr:UPF0481 protein At3g47200-like [Phoenix dactylifera]
MDSSEKAKGKEKVETTEASETIIAVGGEDNSRAAGGLSPGDIGAYASRMDEATDVWAKKMLDKIDVVLQRAPSYTASKSISTAPASTEDRDKKLYKPRAVAIGPHHRKEDNYFRITDEHKLWCVKKVIGDSYKQDLGKFLGKMKERKEDAVKFYRERYGTDNNSGLDCQSFLEMLMLDSCFILFALSFHYGHAKVLPNLSGFTTVPWARRDIVRALDLVKSDLLLLSNQIPFFILEDVFKMKNDIDPTKKMQNGGNEGNGSIREDALNFFDNLGLGRNSSKGTETKEVDHLLDLYHMYLEPPDHSSDNLEDIGLLIDPHRYVPSATELRRKSAVNFKKKKIVTQSVLDVTTCKFGHIQMPALRVEDHTNILLHNLVSFEESSGTTDSYITAYVAFMDCIVQREEDVELLENRGVLEHRLTSPAEVVALFGQFHDVIDHQKTPGYLAKVYKEVIRCRHSKWRRMYADAKQRYCSSVWLSISFVAGITLSVAALIQTIYTITGSYKK